MRGIVNAREGVEIEVRVALRGGYAAVAEQLLNGAQIRAAFQKVRGKGVAQIVLEGFFFFLAISIIF